MSRLPPGTTVYHPHFKHTGRVLGSSPLGYRFTVRWQNEKTGEILGEEEAVEVKWIDGEPGGGIFTAGELEIVDSNRLDD